MNSLLKLWNATSCGRRVTPRVVHSYRQWSHHRLPSIATTTKIATTIGRRSLHLTPREVDHLQLHNVGRLAQYRLARGLKLNVPEAIGLITMQMMEQIRGGQQDVASLMTL